MSINGAEPALVAPFGGFKESGIGRESGPEGFMNYIELQTISRPG
jgi:acyl-CoA reductase-like NAD-dependent aldehyde dehydrogenase